jgi:ribosomal protein S18 acetylase RimI-like enzyme
LDREPVSQGPPRDFCRVRAAVSTDAKEIAAILAEAFPALYRTTFGRLNIREVVRLLSALYAAGHLSLATTYVCEREGQVVGALILHLGQPIGRGQAGDYWRLLTRELGLWRAARAFWGGLLATRMLERRIPHAFDLVYIEALAVTEAHRGQGIGSRLLAEAERYARSTGRSRLALHVLSSNTAARRLYTRVGFKPWEGHTSPYRWGALLLERILPGE